MTRVSAACMRYVLLRRIHARASRLRMRPSRAALLATAAVALPRARGGADGLVSCSPAPCPPDDAVKATGATAGVRSIQLPALRAFLRDASDARWKPVRPRTMVHCHTVHPPGFPSVHC